MTATGEGERYQVVPTATASAAAFVGALGTLDVELIERYSETRCRVRPVWARKGPIGEYVELYGKEVDIPTWWLKGAR